MPLVPRRADSNASYSDTLPVHKLRASSLLVHFELSLPGYYSIDPLTWPSNSSAESLGGNCLSGVGREHQIIHAASFQDLFREAWIFAEDLQLNWEKAVSYFPTTTSIFLSADLEQEGLWR